MRLSDNDRRAVDLLMDRPTGTGNGNGHAFALSGGEFATRVQRIESLLQLLDYVPVSDPPADLVARTMRRIEEAAPMNATMRPGAATGTSAQRPTA